MVIADSWGRRSAAHRSFFRPAAVSREGGAARARVQLRLARTPAGCGNDPSVLPASTYRVRDDTTGRPLAPGLSAVLPGRLFATPASSALEERSPRSSESMASTFSQSSRESQSGHQ